MTKKGFTLIEFLVVVAIIAIMAACLVPVFTGRTHVDTEYYPESYILDDTPVIYRYNITYVNGVQKRVPVYRYRDGSTSSTKSVKRISIAAPNSGSGFKGSSGGSFGGNRNTSSFGGTSAYRSSGSSSRPSSFSSSSSSSRSSSSSSSSSGRR